MAAAYASQTTNQKVFESIPGRSRRGRGESDADGPACAVVRRVRGQVVWRVRAPLLGKKRTRRVLLNTVHAQYASPRWGCMLGVF